MNKATIASKYYHFFTLSADMLCCLDFEGFFVEANPTWEGVLGLSTAELIGKSVVEFIHPLDQPLFTNEIQHLREGAELTSFECRQLTGDGSYSWLAWQMKVDLEECLIYGIAQDVTHRKEVEESARQRHRELELLNRVIAASVTTLEPEEILDLICRELALTLDISRVVAALLNKDKTEERVVAEYLNKNKLSVMGQKFPVVANSTLQYLLTYKAPLAIYDARHDARLVHLQTFLEQQGIVSMLLLPLVIKDEVVGRLTLETSETHRFSAEEISLAWSVADQVAAAFARMQMAQTHRRLITAIEQTTDSIFVTNSDDNIIYVNPAFEQITGYKRAEVVGRKPLDFLYEVDKDEALYQELWTTISQGQVWQGRVTNRKKNGQSLVEDVTITPVRNELREITGYVTVKRDRTHELQLEEQLRQSQKLEAVGRLAGGVAHDFNNLLMIIAGHTELLLQSHSDNKIDFYEELGEIKKAAERATRLTRQLLAFSRRQLIQPRILDINQILAGMSQMLQWLIGPTIHLVVDLVEEPLYVKADPSQLEQLIMNLVINGRDAMPRGGSLIVQVDDLTLTNNELSDYIGLEPGDYVLLTIIDTGIGMDEETKAHIFEPFFTTKEQGKGTGLGLATTYGIVQQNNGHIRVKSLPHRGTTFEVYFPRKSTVQQSVKEDVVHPISIRGSETILLVEDETDVRHLVKKILEQVGYTILEAENGQDALDQWEQTDGPIHLIITDVAMPQMGGQALVQQLRQTNANLRVIYISGYTNKADLQMELTEARADFLQKPFDADDLKQKVRQILDAR